MFRAEGDPSDISNIFCQRLIISFLFGKFSGNAFIISFFVLYYFRKLNEVMCDEIVAFFVACFAFVPGMRFNLNVED
jgi:hypothetical protein